MRNVLVIDDDDIFRSNLCMGLNLENYETFESPSGEHGLLQFNQINFDVVLLDLDLPVMNGLEVLKRKKNHSDTPVIMISGKYTQEDVRRSFMEHVNDFLFKPFIFDELLASIKKIETKNSKPEKSNIIKANDIEIDVLSQTVRVRGTVVHFSNIEYKILKLFIEHKGEILSNEFILTKIWGDNHAYDNEYIKNNVYQIRVKIEEILNIPKIIINIHGRGYKISFD